MLFGLLKTRKKKIKALTTDLLNLFLRNCRKRRKKIVLFSKKHSPQAKQFVNDFYLQSKNNKNRSNNQLRESSIKQSKDQPEDQSQEVFDLELQPIKKFSNIEQRDQFQLISSQNMNVYAEEFAQK